MEQPPGFVAQGEYGLVCKLHRSFYGLKQSPRAWFGKFSHVVRMFGLKRSEADHSVFYCHTSPEKCVYLIVYVDDIVITRNDTTKITQLKEHLFSHFQIKDLGPLKYFLGIEVAQSGDGVVISQRKYALDILEETGMQNCRPVESPMDPNLKFMADQSDVYPDPERYRRLVEKLIYLTITRPDISFAVGVVSHFMQNPHLDHWNAVMRILRYVKKAPGQGLLYEDKGNTQLSGYCDADWAGCPMDRRSTLGYCVFIGGNLISWKSKKQTVVARSSAEAEYRSMTMVTCELMWIKQFLQELRFCEELPMKLYCDNQAALHIASNPVFHERTKHIEIDCHFIREKFLSKEIVTEFIGSNDQPADILTKSLRGPKIQIVALLVSLFRRAAVSCHCHCPSLSILWVYEGIIDDPYGEFFIAEDKSLQKESLTQDYEAKYWRQRYSLKDGIPSFLENIAGTILTTGKYLNVMRECGHNVQVPPSENSKLMSFGSNHHYLECIKAAYNFASGELLNLIKEKYDLTGRLRSIKHYLLLDQLVSERVTVLITVRHRLLPSPATISSGESRVGCTLRSVTHLCKLRGQNLSHAPPPVCASSDA
ncbi:Retrovirus-related Pol polyprotein from transposon RE2 [Glycine soja]|uniref:Retrovirus-related Pol polyprotein from transposon RE2 n=1 Tax=Glycine soja TaxID=3848 RepID=A0A445GG24_GLYSO|nr:Retrovirus-related Pol polyprotein from transposon RE2 [Glycine soja]